MSGSLTSFVIPIFVGVLIAIAVFFLIGGRYSEFVRKLLDAHAESEESAKALSDLGIKKKSSLLRALKDGSSLRKSVMVTKDAGGEARYYIPPENADRAASLFVKKKSSLGMIILGAILLVAVLFVIFNFVPSILEMAKNI